jgi:hypothetical protein
MHVSVPDADLALLLITSLSDSWDTFSASFFGSNSTTPALAVSITVSTHDATAMSTTSSLFGWTIYSSSVHPPKASTTRDQKSLLNFKQPTRVTLDSSLELRFNAVVTLVRLKSRRANSYVKYSLASAWTTSHPVTTPLENSNHLVPATFFLYGERHFLASLAVPYLALYGGSDFCDTPPL